MKQFLFKLPFIVASAFIYIQCAKLLPNGGKIIINRTPVPHTNSSAYLNHIGASFADKTTIHPSGSAIIIPVKPALFLNNNIMGKPAAAAFFYNPYLNFSNYGPATKYTGNW